MGDGFGMTAGTVDLRMVSIAAPVRSESREIVAAINMAAHDGVG